MEIIFKNKLNNIFHITMINLFLFKAIDYREVKSYKYINFKYQNEILLINHLYLYICIIFINNNNNKTNNNTFFTFQ